MGEDSEDYLRTMLTILLGVFMILWVILILVTTHDLPICMLILLRFYERQLPGVFMLALSCIDFVFCPLTSVLPSYVVAQEGLA